MATYLVPGVMPESVRIHFQQTGIASRICAVTQPVSVEGYTIPEREAGCSQFLFDAGLTRDDFLSAQPTDEDGLLLVRSNGSVPRAGNRSCTVNYRGSGRVNELLKRLAQEHQVDIVCVPPSSGCFSNTTEYPTCSGCSRLDDDDESVLTIHLNCGDMGRQNNPPLSSLYEFALGGGPARRVKLFPLTPSGNEQVVYDSNGTPVAEVDDGSIYILVNLEAYEDNYYGDRHYWSHNAEVLERILAEAIPIALGQNSRRPSTPRYQIEVERRRRQLQSSSERAIEECLRQVPYSLNQRMVKIEKNIRVPSRDAEEHLQVFLHSQQQMREEQQMLNALREQSHGGDEELRRQLANILSMPEVIGINFTDHLEVYTDTIFIGWDGRYYRIGSFRIDIRPDGVRIASLYKERGSGGYDHPHISNQRPCFGNISEAVAEMLKEGQLEMLVTVLIQFLKSYDKRNPHRGIENWPIVAD